MQTLRMWPTSSPSFPLNPFSPSSPLSPFSPLNPFAPGSPFWPRGPVTPGNPGGPATPCIHWQHYQTFHKVWYTTATMQVYDLKTLLGKCLIVHVFSRRLKYTYTLGHTSICEPPSAKSHSQASTWVTHYAIKVLGKASWEQDWDQLPQSGKWTLKLCIFLLWSREAWERG